jgi:ATP-dependent DNA helicase RecG
MTATPIPRTVAMTVFGDMETATSPSCRPVGSRSTPTSSTTPGRGGSSAPGRGSPRRSAKGHQAYVVCPKIGDPTDGSDAHRDTSDEDAGWADEGTTGSPVRGPGGRRAAGAGGETGDGRAGRRGRWPACMPWHDRSCEQHPALGGAADRVLHGRLPADAKERVMTASGRGEIDVLVATTVIEVGVDVPNATRHGRHGRRPVRDLATASAAWPGRVEARPRACACS